MDLIRGARLLVVAGLLFGIAPTDSLAQAASDPYYSFLLGRHLESEGDAPAALAALERAAAADPRSAEVRAEIASLQYRRNRRAEAEKAAKEALAIDAGNVEANRILGLAYAAAAENEQNTGAQTATYVRDAITHLERAMAGGQGPADPTLNFTVGRMYLAINEPAKAIAALQRVVSQNPYSVQGRMMLAQAHASARDLKSAIATLDVIAEDAPQVLAVLGQYQQRAGLLPQAIDSYTKALETQPNNQRIKTVRILALYEAQMYQQAVAAAADAKRDHPDQPDFPRLQASAMFKAGDTGGAIQILESSVKAFPRDSSSQLALADLYSDTGRADDAEKILRQVIAAEPSNANALNYLGYILAQNGKDLDEAIRLVNRALQVEPGNGAYLDSLGWAHFQRGDLNEAEKYLGAAAERMPGNSEVLDHLGDLHARRGRWQEAIASWTRALEGDGSGIEASVVRRKIADARAKAGQ
jgi:tetratricopeptide (TPR) repeat protein